MHHHTEQFDSILALCDAVDATRTTTAQWGETYQTRQEWIRYQEYQSTLDNLEWSTQYGSLEGNIDQARTLTGIEYLCTHLDMLIAQLAGTVQPPASVRRVPTWGRSGTRVSVSRVLAGNLQHAWRQTTAVVRPHHGKILTVVLHGSFTAQIDQAQILWSTAASLALAALAEQAGYRCALWHVHTAQNVYGDGTGIEIATQLKAAEQPWNTQNVAVTLHGGFLRRLLLRLCEAGTGQGWGPVNRGYGYRYQDETAQIDAWARRSDLQGVIHGALQDDGIRTAEQARAWVGRQLTHCVA